METTPSNSRPLLKTHDLTKIYRQESRVPVRALDAINFTAEKGEFTAIAGPSGSGKTTLLNMIGGLDKPTSGSVTVAGRNVTEMTRNELAEFRLRYLGFVFQAYNLIPVLSALENAEYTLLLQGVEKSERRRRVIEELADLGIGEDLVDRGVVGGDFAGYLGGAGLRGEAAYNWTDNQRSFLRAVGNIDYTFYSGYYLMVELYYNGAGTRSPSAYDYDALVTGQTFSLAKEYGAFLVSKSITPLFTAQWYNLFNFDDQSGLSGPSVTYSLSQNLEIGLSGYFFYGSSQAEYGALSNAYFGTAQYYF